MQRTDVSLALPAVTSNTVAQSCVSDVVRQLIPALVSWKIVCVRVFVLVSESM